MKADQSARNDERCQEWCAWLETLRQNPRHLSSIVGGPSSEDLSFGADTAALPHGFVVAAAATFGLNLKTPWGTALLLLILADVVFRPENPAKRGRPSGTKKWNQRELANLGFRAAIIETNKPGISDYDTALELQKIYPKEYGYMTENTLRQLIPNALQAHKARLAALRAPKSTLQN